MAKPPGPGRCVHCLKLNNYRTWDHVFPKAWYPQSTPSNLAKWQIPSCSKCNKDYGKLEDELLVRIGLALDPNEFESEGIVQKAFRAINPEYGKSSKDKRRRQAKRDKILREAMFGDEIPDHGGYPGLDDARGQSSADRMAIPFQALHIRRLTEKIVRGIFYIEDGMFIEPPYMVHFFALSDEGADPIRTELDKFGTEYAREPGIVVRRAVANDDQVSSLFEIEVWGRLRMYAAVDNEPDH